MSVAQEQDTRILKLRLIFHGSHCFTSTQTNLLLPRKNDSTIYFIRVYKAWQYEYLIEQDFLYRILYSKSIPNSCKERFPL
jgi:hypothetical protein